MLINIFRSNKPTAYFLLPVIAAALWSFSFIQPPAIEASREMPLYRLLIWLLGRGGIIPVVFSMLLLCAEAILLNVIINQKEISLRNNNLTALLYLVIMSSCLPLLAAHPALPANFFLILAVRRIMNIYRQEVIFSQCFDAGFFVCIASLFYFPAVAFFPFVWISIAVLRPFNWRDWIIAFIGFLVPYFFLTVYYFWLDQPGWLWHESTAFVLSGRQVGVKSDPSFYFLAVMAVIILYLSFGKLSSGLAKNTVREKKFLIVLVWFFVFSLLSIILAPSISVTSFAISAIPLSVYSTNYFLAARNRWVAEGIFALLIASIIYGQVAQGGL